MDCDCRYCRNSDYCQGCGEYIYDCMCEGSQGHGHSNQTPWEVRGISVTNITEDTNWEKAWKTLGKNHMKFDPCQQAADFYLLEALSANMPCLEGTGHIKKIPYVQKKDLTGLFADLDIDNRLVTKAYNTGKANVSKNVERRIGLLMGEAESELVKLVDHADRVLIEYFHMAVAGEARHHRAVGNRVLCGSSNRSGAWVGWKAIYKKIGNQALMDLSELFLEFTDGSYGGKPWADAAEVLYERLEGNLGPDEFTNKKMFVDRAWTLEHNGGCFLNKINWGILNEKEWGLDYLTRVLDAHASNPTNYKKLLKLASKKVVKLYNRYFELQNKYRKLNGLELVTNLVTAPVVKLTYCKRCGSNPERGHLLACAGYKSTQTYTVDEDDYHAPMSQAWHYEAYPVNTDKQIVPGKYKISSYVTAVNKGWYDSVNWKDKTITVKEGDIIDFDDLFCNKVTKFLSKQEGFENWKDETYVSVGFSINALDYNNYVGELVGPLKLVYRKGKLVKSNLDHYGSSKKTYVIGSVEKESKAEPAFPKPEIVYTYNLERKTLEPSKAKVITVESKVK